MRVAATKSNKDHLCNYCELEFVTCPKANHLKFGNEPADDNVVECSGFVGDVETNKNLMFTESIGKVLHGSDMENKRGQRD